MSAILSRSVFSGAPVVAAISPNSSVQTSRRKTARVVTAVVGPQVSWDSASSGTNSGASRMIENLERRARAAAAVAAERVLTSDSTTVASPGLFLTQQRSRLKEWWTDHLAFRAHAVEAALGHGEGEVEGEEEVVVIEQPSTTRVREAENDRARNSLREFYYPRSDPSKYN